MWSLFLFFFFSSRRRHTRCSRDWSSDVCSSDLDLAGVAASGGSACSTGAMEPSHVLSAMGVPRALALGSIRLSLGHETRAEDLDRVVEVFPKVVEKVRKLSVVLGRA